MLSPPGETEERGKEWREVWRVRTWVQGVERWCVRTWVQGVEGGVGCMHMGTRSGGRDGMYAHGYKEWRMQGRHLQVVGSQASY